MAQYRLIPLYLTAIVIIIGFIILAMILKDKYDENEKNIKFNKMLRYSYSTDVTISKKLKDSRTISEKIVDTLRNAFPEINASNEQLLAFTGAFVGAIFIVIFVLTGNILIGIVPVFTLALIVNQLANSKESKRTKLIEEQIPSFVAVFKANLQANQPNSVALMNAIENTAVPLYDELKVAKALTQTGTFKAALLTLRKKTKNESLRFLFSCIELSTDTGGRLEPQIKEIEEMLKIKRDHERKLDSAVSENKPLILVASIMLPGLFFGLYMFSAEARAYWFVEPLSWIILIVIIVFYFGALYFANKIVNGLRG